MAERVPLMLPPGDEVTHLAQVQTSLNRLPFRTDRALYGREDYWARPAEFLVHGGDCEDYAIAKMAALRALGWPEEAMRLVVVEDMGSGRSHALLWAETKDGRAWLLDNQSKDLLPAETQRRYRPIGAINALGRWRYDP